jgi:hypothetical protein
MLNFRIARSPLTERENGQILFEYNRLTSSQIPLNEFVHWVQHGPAGTAWHAILETDEGRIVGHTSLFPLRTGCACSALTPAKSEYSFLHEDFRNQKIHGHEDATKPAFIIILDRLFKHCIREGWGPIFASTREKNQVFTRRVGLRPLEFPLWECLLALRPVNASRHTPNLTRGQRAALLAVGLAQSVTWSIASVVQRRNGVHAVPMAAGPLSEATDRLSFFEDSASLEWRYFADQYLRLALDSKPGDYVIAKRGSSERYLRVCQWRLGEAQTVRPLINFLIDEARRQKAIGVRWAVYDDGNDSTPLVDQLRSAGFLCKRRVRIVMVHNQDPQFLVASKWNMNDSLFSFDP